MRDFIQESDYFVDVHDCDGDHGGDDADDDGDDDGNHHSENGCRERQGLTLR